jgi:hypothetical protein
MITIKLMRRPDVLDHDNEACLFVIKNANVSGVTIGIFSFVRDEGTREESIEWAIYGYDNDSAISQNSVTPGRSYGSYRWTSYRRYWQDGNLGRYPRHPHVVALAPHQESLPPRQPLPPPPWPKNDIVGAGKPSRFIRFCDFFSFLRAPLFVGWLFV